MSETIQSIIHTPQASLLLRADGIIQLEGKNHQYSVADIRALHAAISEITFGKKARLLLIGNSYTSIDIEARQFLSTPEAANVSVAEAYVIQSLAQRLLLSFLVRVTSSLVPRRFFSDTGAAVEWLQGFE